MIIIKYIKKLFYLFLVISLISFSGCAQKSPKIKDVIVEKNFNETKDINSTYKSIKYSDSSNTSLYLFVISTWIISIAYIPYSVLKLPFSIIKSIFGNGENKTIYNESNTTKF